MADDLLIRGGHVVDPASGWNGPGDLLIRGGLIERLAEQIAAEPEIRVIEAEGMVVSPGFIDLHVHLRYPGFPQKETVASGTAAAAAGGFTTVCAMANTSPVVDSLEVLAQVEQEVARSAVVRVYQLAAVSRGLSGQELTDLPALAAAGVPAFSDDGKPIWNAGLMRNALRAARDLNLPISLHEEDPAIVGPGVVNAGEHARALGLPEWPCTGEAGMAARDAALLAEIGGRLHVAHVSCADTVPVLRAAHEQGLRLTAEVTPHHLCLTDRLLRGDEGRSLPPGSPLVKVNPPLRSPGDVEMLIDALADGTIGAIATDHAPHAAEDKAGSMLEAAYGFTGSELALPLLLSLVRAGSLSLSTLIERLTVGPARIFSLPGGMLAPGAPADVCVFDPDVPWTLTPEALKSRGKNTPLLGTEVRGRVRYTLVGGQIVHS